MVFNWFERQAEESLKPEPTPTPAPTPEPTDAGTEAPVSAAPEPTPAPAATEEEDEALVWAREAYARLKAQQHAAASVVEVAPESTPAPSPEPAPTPPPTPTPTSTPGPAPLPTPSLSPLPTPSPAPAPGLSLLEQAAAQRQQRQQDLDQRAVEAPPAPTPAPTPAPVVDSEEPQLGDFDQDFTWSAEVLAAQGRRVDQVSLEEIDWLGRLRRGLEKTRQGFVTSLLENLGDDPLTPEVLDDLETLLLRADAGVQATDQVLDALRQRMNEEVVDPAEGIRFLKEQLRGLLDAPIQASGVPLLAPERDRLNIWLMVGVNGVGKTTTLGKLANLAVRSGYSALIAAADTFRAAAVQQVEVWGERSDVPVVSNPSSNADPAAVVFDAIGAARSRKSDLLLVDTAGRLQTKHNLMEELQKVRKIIDRLAPEAKVESLLVLDASQGQNGLRQAMAFAQAAGLTGVVITKLDGTARGGVALAVSSEAGLPIRFIGAGEGIRDLRPFNSFEFVEALLAGR
ncbi:signal recognition particle-docking protein FtsY [Synechococcus sp. CC9605]|uniref:signal recognition particle-docking protein FtsY n=1 Tax=Synechococcus sp. (strain CC9605) TaxID=110662 RepID=UPI00005D5578|nr:signal recognition particle-docking protein FtsY [Synechococcus sp. CC9605]ABB33793.1 signal recognition particle-docking protein FtsY [Synechococcus sp. CC9605]